MPNATSSTSNYGTGVYVTVSLYMAFLLTIAFLSWFRNKNTESTVSSHYLASKSFGPIVLSFTLFATMYSGYTVVGVPTDAYVNGWMSLKWMGAILALVVGSLFIHPIIRKLSVARMYLSPVDFIHDRYHSKFLRLLVAFCMIIPTWLYLTAQFTAMGNSIYGLSNGNIPTYVGSSVLGIIILLYETFGGLKGVAWTDVLQGFLLLVGFLCLSGVMRGDFGSLESLVPELERNRPPLVLTPTEKQIKDFFSFVLLWTCFPLYPHVLQRIYAAKSTTTLRITLTLMSFSAFITMIPGIVLGLYGASLMPTDNPAVDGKGFFGRIMEDILSRGLGNAVVVTIVLTSSLAAIMSTADSALIGLSNVISVDIFKGWLAPSYNERKLVMVGKISSIISAAICLAISIGGLDLTKLAVLQSSVLIQCLPGFIMGFYWPGMRALPVSVGMVVGLFILLLLSFGFEGHNLHFAPGVWGLFANWVLTIIVQVIISKFMANKFPLPVLPADVQSNLDDVEMSNRTKSRGSVLGDLNSIEVTDNSWDRFGSIPLTHEVIKGYMAKIRQPISCWPLALLALISLLFHVPLFTTPGVRASFSNGMPRWAAISLASLTIGCCTTAFLFGYWWRTVDDEETEEDMQLVAHNRDNSSGGDEAKDPIIPQ